MVKIIIHVEDGLVQAVYADSDDVSVEVCDLDESDFADDGEQAAADLHRQEMNDTIKQEGWRCVW